MIHVLKLISHNMNKDLKCKCGYIFAIATASPKRGFVSYAVINNKDYMPFIKSETNVLMAKDDINKLSLIAHSSKYIASLYECPQCSRLLFFRLGRNFQRPIFYTKEADPKIRRS
jgi:hypothetical protein